LRITGSSLEARFPRILIIGVVGMFLFDENWLIKWVRPPSLWSSPNLSLLYVMLSFSRENTAYLRASWSVEKTIESIIMTKFWYLSYCISLWALERLWMAQHVV
jgi:lipid-A-disaccharide synthase-like uncharacterized protein